MVPESFELLQHICMTTMRPGVSAGHEVPGCEFVITMLSLLSAAEIGLSNPLDHLSRDW